MARKDLEAEAREVPEARAPRPVGSYLTYGLIGVVLMAVAIGAVASFYGLNPTALPVAVLIAASFVGGLILRRIRRERYRAAYDAARASDKESK